MAAYNKNNAGVKRIMAEARELGREPSTEYTAKPTEEDLFDWHCTIRGPSDTEFEGGLYHARIVLPPEYPFKAPSVMLLTPNGRFEMNKRICISFTSYHEDLWQPSWGVRTAIIGLQSFFPVKGEAAMGVGGIEVPINERKRLAGLSRDWVCPHCNQSNLDMLPDLIKPQETATTELSRLVASCAEESTAKTPTSSDTALPNPPALEKDGASSIATQALPPHQLPSKPPTSQVTEPNMATAGVRTPRPSSSPLPVVAVTAASPPPHPQSQVPVPPVQALQHSRPLDLTPSTPAARVIDEVGSPAHGGTGARDREAMMDNLGVHPAVYQYTGANGEQGGEAQSARERGYAVGRPGARASPLVLDILIGALGVVLAYVVLRRFL